MRKFIYFANIESRIKRFVGTSRLAFSLFELLVCIVILGVIGIICGEMLLNISKNLAFLRLQNDKGTQIALLKIENILQSALPQSINLDNNSSSITFIRIDEALLNGSSHKAGSPNISGDALLPTLPITIESYANSTIYMRHTSGWENILNLVLFSPQNNLPKLYAISKVSANSIVLQSPIDKKPYIAIPASQHKVFLENNTLYFDSVALAFNVTSFAITSQVLPNNSIFLNIDICLKHICHSGGVWLEDIIESL